MNPLPPDPEGRNEERSDTAEVIIDTFESETGEDREDALAQLLSHLMHWTDRNGVDFVAELKRALRIYKIETAQ